MYVGYEFSSLSALTQVVQNKDKVELVLPTVENRKEKKSTQAQ